MKFQDREKIGFIALDDVKVDELCQYFFNYITVHNCYFFWTELMI